MLERVLIIGLGLAALGCRMDNPAFDLERGTGVADESGDGDTTNPNESGESIGEGEGDGDGDAGDGDGDSGDGDGDPSESSSDGPDTTTDGDCLAGASCGPCQVCDDFGDCVIDVGGPCDGPQTHCADHLFGAVDGICYRLPDVTLGGRCSEQGLCEASPASDCPSEQGAIVFECEPGCVIQGNAEGCPKYGNAEEADLAAMCVTGGEPGPDCKTICSNETGSAIKNYGCAEGECVFLGNQQLCGNYACDEQGLFCYQSCETEAQCAQLMACINQQCMPG